ncbi:MAG: sigma-70 family RNA polymerase sigma factor [Anaerolineae bacterium]|nr:sigma-70 family RNA polymerase sigma factor [Anaerolineae bacterium]
MNMSEDRVVILDADEDNSLRFPETEIIPESIDHIPSDDTVSLYFRQMASEPLLTSEQEVLLARRIERGYEAQKQLQRREQDASNKEIVVLEASIRDAQAAREHLGRANTRLVVSIAKRYRNQGLPMSDLIQEGNVGLMIAVDKFDYRLGNRFSTYASWWILQAVTRAVSQKSRTIRLPLHLADRLRRVTIVKQIMGQELGREPSDEELSRRLDLTPQEVRETLEANMQTIALETPIGDDSELGDLIEDDQSVSPDDMMHMITLGEVVTHILNDLPPREAQILRLRFGLANGIPQTLEQVGKAFGLSRERIRQLERQALQQLRQPQFTHTLRDILA